MFKAEYLFHTTAKGATARANRMAERKYPTLNKEVIPKIRRRTQMEETKFIRVEEVARVLDISESHAYKIMRKLNRELEAKGYLTVAGRVNRQYFNERLYGAERSDANAGV